MRHRFAGLMIAAVAAALPHGASSAEMAGAESGKHCLWRVRSDTTTMYLLGSVHVMKPDAYPLDEEIERAFDGSTTVVFEVDLGADGTAEAALGMLSAGMLPEGSTLADVVSPATHRLAVERLEASGLDPGGMARMRPWMVATTLTLTELQRAGYSPTDGVDRHFFGRSKAGGKTVVGLETIQFQLGLFADMTPEEDEAFLRQTVRELDLMIPMVDELIGHWKAGRVAEVEALLSEGYREFPELFAKLVRNRNANWLPTLEELLAGDETVFVVVGALHVIGDDGLVDLLRKRGYSVEQV